MRHRTHSTNSLHVALIYGIPCAVAFVFVTPLDYMAYLCKSEGAQECLIMHCMCACRMVHVQLSSQHTIRMANNPFHVLIDNYSNCQAANAQTMYDTCADNRIRLYVFIVRHRST